MEQLIGMVEEVITTVAALLNGSLDWPTACTRLPQAG